jgi:hypothetical protein
MKQRQQTQRLRKQPKMRHLQAAAAVPVPRLSVPKTAKRRRKRNQQRFSRPIKVVKQVVFSARWISLALLSLTIYALVLTGMDEDFYLTLIPVEGVVSIPPEEIVTASRLAGAHIFAADPNQAAARIAQLSGVISATVTLSWPNQVLIQIREDTPIAIWQEGSAQYWITQDGRLTPARTATIGLLTIESELPPVAAGDGSEETSQVDQSNLPFVPGEVLAGALQLRQLRPNIDKLYYRPPGGLSYQDGRGWRAYFGAGRDMQQKLVVYETIVEDLLARGLTPTYVSVSNQKKPYYKVP